MSPDATVPASPVDQAMHRRICEFLQSCASEVSAPVLLAIAAHIVGQIIALQDQRTMTWQKALKLVCQNIEAGNRAAIEELTTKTAGSA